MKQLTNRLRKLEPTPPVPPRAPHVLEIASGETIDDAFARFRARWPNVRPGHTFMVVPATMTPAEFRIHSEARRAERRLAVLSKDALQ